jgi:hypothetical protein
MSENSAALATSIAPATPQVPAIIVARSKIIDVSVFEASRQATLNAYNAKPMYYIPVFDPNLEIGGILDKDYETTIFKALAKGASLFSIFDSIKAGEFVVVTRHPDFEDDEQKVCITPFLPFNGGELTWTRFVNHFIWRIGSWGKGDDEQKRWEGWLESVLQPMVQSSGRPDLDVVGGLAYVFLCHIENPNPEFVWEEPGATAG